MENLLKVLFLLTIYFVVKSENFAIRSKKSHTKRMTKNDTKIEKEAASSMNVTLRFSNLKRRKDSEASIENDSDDLSSYPYYKFAYKVYDPETGDDKEHEESRDGGVVQGEYSFMEPDGSRRIVTYISNGTDGFNAIVTKVKPPVDTEIQQSQKDYTEHEASEVSTSPHKTDSDNLDNVEHHQTTSQNFTDETEKQTHELIQEAETQNSNSERLTNSTEPQEDNVNIPAERSDESALWFPSQTEYLRHDVEQNPIEQQPNQEKSKKRSVLKISNNNTPQPQLIKYMIAIPQNFYIPVNSNKDEVVSNYKENLKSAVKKQKKSRRNVQIMYY